MKYLSVTLREAINIFLYMARRISNLIIIPITNPALSWYKHTFCGKGNYVFHSVWQENSVECKPMLIKVEKWKKWYFDIHTKSLLLYMSFNRRKQLYTV
jgi:hypothetical protein